MNLKIKLDKLICLDPQDPCRDEIYFVITTKEFSFITETFKIKRGQILSGTDLVSFEVKYDYPVVIQMVEQAGRQDKHALARLGKAVIRNAFNIADVLGITGGIQGTPLTVMLETLSRVIAERFTDSVLGVKTISSMRGIPTGEFESVDYVLKASSKSYPTYDYVATFKLSLSEDG